MAIYHGVHFLLFIISGALFPSDALSMPAFGTCEGIKW